MNCMAALGVERAVAMAVEAMVTATMAVVARAAATAAVAMVAVVRAVATAVVPEAVRDMGIVLCQARRTSHR